MDDDAFVSLDEKLMFSQVGGSLVGVLKGSPEMHFFEGSAEDVVRDLQSSGMTVGQLKSLQCARYPGVDSAPLVNDLLAFLSDASAKRLISVTKGA